jgi:hypothetical protein
VDKLFLSWCLFEIFSSNYSLFFCVLIFSTYLTRQVHQLPGHYTRELVEAKVSTAQRINRWVDSSFLLYLSFFAISFLFLL